MSTIINTVVVHGATGQQGGSIVRALSGAGGYTIRAAVREPDALKAQALAALPGVQLVRIDLGDAQTLTAAYTGADAVFACTVPAFLGSGSELEHGQAMADAAKAAGVKLLIWSALPSISELTGGALPVRHFDDKAAVAAYITRLGVPATMMYLGGFMENYVNLPGQATYDAAEDKIVLQFGGIATHKKLQFLSVTKDVGAAVSIILAHVDEFVGQSVSIGHVTLSVNDQARIIEKISGKRCCAVQGPETPVPDFNNFFKFFNEREGSMPPGLSSANALLDKYGFKPTSFEEFVQEALLPHLKL